MLIDYRVQLREYLLQISRAITAQLNLDDVLQLVLEAATRILAEQAGLIALRDPDGDFAICNIGITTGTELEISDSFSLPVSGALILNPATEQFHVVVGISF